MQTIAADAPLVWHNERRKVSQLVPYEANPREMTEKDVADLTESLKRFNLVEVPAIDLDNRICAGHQRLRIMSMIGRGEEEVDVRVPNRKLSEEEFREYLVRSNRNTGRWDFDVLANNFGIEELKAWGFEDYELTGYFEPSEIVIASGGEAEGFAEGDQFREDGFLRVNMTGPLELQNDEAFKQDVAALCEKWKLDYKMLR